MDEQDQLVAVAGELDFMADFGGGRDAAAQPAGTDVGPLSRPDETGVKTEPGTTKVVMAREGVKEEIFSRGHFPCRKKEGQPSLPFTLFVVFSFPETFSIFLCPTRLKTQANSSCQGFSGCRLCFVSTLVRDCSSGNPGVGCVS